MIIICAVGMEWESKAQNFLVAIIVAAIFNFIIGAFLGPRSELEHAEGFIGFNSEFSNQFCKKYIFNFFKLLQPLYLLRIGDQIFDLVKRSINRFSVFLLYSSHL